VSTSDLYILNEKSTRHLAEFRNGWGSAAIAWDHLAEKYIPEKPVYTLSGDHMKKVWALAGDSRLAGHERVVLMMTFDRAYVETAYLGQAAEACERFGAETQDGLRVNHWAAIGAWLRKASTMKLGRHARGICLSCTSVSDMWGEPTNEQLVTAWPIYAELTAEEAAE
jgi:hypothetical protein